MPRSSTSEPTADAAAHTPWPTADHAVAHTLLNCLLREVSGPEHQTAVTDGRLLLRLPRRGVVLRVALRRSSLIGAHRFSGAVARQCPGGWAPVDWRDLADLVHAELSLRTGVANDEFLAQVASSHRAVSAALARRARLRRHADPASGGWPGGETPDERLASYLESEQALALGHRFHPTPKAHGADPETWSAYAPEAGARFSLRHLAVRHHLITEDGVEPRAIAALDRLGPVPAGYRLLPVHPWQFRLLAGHPLLGAALDRGDIVDLGVRGRQFTATASVRTLYDGELFVKFSLNVRITNCVRKNAAYELPGSVALTRALAPVARDLAARFDGAAILGEPAFRAPALPDGQGTTDRSLLEGLGVIVRDGLGTVLRPGTTALLAGAVADEYPTSPGQLSRLLGQASAATAQRWWASYLRLLIPPVLAAYFDHGVVLEPHLQNVVVAVDDHGMPTQMIFRDLEGTKLVAERHRATLSDLPAEVAGPMAYDAERGWDRVVYCLLVNHVAETLAALADRYPDGEPDLWRQVHTTLEDYAVEHGCPPRLRALLAGVPLPAKANLLTRWERRADRHASYVRLASPFAPGVLSGAMGGDRVSAPPQGGTEGHPTGSADNTGGVAAGRGGRQGDAPALAGIEVGDRPMSSGDVSTTADHGAGPPGGGRPDAGLAGGPPRVSGGAPAGATVRFPVFDDAGLGGTNPRRNR